MKYKARRRDLLIDKLAKLINFMFQYLSKKYYSIKYHYI